MKKIGFHEHPRFISPVFYTWMGGGGGGEGGEGGVEVRVSGTLLVGKYRLVLLMEGGESHEMRFLSDLRQIKRFFVFFLLFCCFFILFNFFF